MNFISLFLLSLSTFFCFSPSQKLAADDWNKRVYLATYPKSGNHWLRYLIEEATLIATSSVYCDTDNWSYSRLHLPTPFPWGGYSPKNGYDGNCCYPEADDIFVVKTHFPVFGPFDFDGLPSIKTIRITRHPVDSFFSFYLNKPPEGPVPSHILKDFISSWREFQEYWDKQPNVVTIRYEDLYNSPKAVFKTIIDAIGYKVQDTDIERAITKCPPKGGTMKYLHLFHPEDLKIIAHELRDLMIKYDYEIPKELLLKEL